MDNQKIGLFITSLRKEKNMTQQDLADKLYVSDKAVSKWERGLSMPDIGIIEKLADILDVSVSEILKGERIKNFSKKNTDEIMKDSIPFFQKEYFKNKITKIIVFVAVFIFISYFALLWLGEIKYGSLDWELFGSKYSIDLPSFSAKKDRKNSEIFLKALKNYDYDIINNILRNHPDGIYVGKTSNIDDYINNLKELKKDGLKIINYKSTYSYFRNPGYATSFDIVFEYDKVKYTVSPQIEGYGKWVISGGLGWTTNDAFNINNPISILETENPELYYKLEKVFDY